jgi:hypothetical protein
MIDNQQYSNLYNDGPLAESLWIEEDAIYNSLKFTLPFLLLVKIKEPKTNWEEEPEWSTFVYHELEKALAHIEKKKKNEHRLYFLNNYGESSKLSLIRNIRRIENESEGAQLVFIDENIKNVFSCSASKKHLGKESDGGPIYLKSYRPTINWLLRN